jgi:hypothetical protein
LVGFAVIQKGEGKGEGRKRRRGEGEGKKWEGERVRGREKRGWRENRGDGVREMGGCIAVCNIFTSHV